VVASRPTTSTTTPMESQASHVIAELLRGFGLRDLG